MKLASGKNDRDDGDFHSAIDSDVSQVKHF